LAGSMLAENPADPSLGHAQLSDHMLHTGPAACGA
jgi:hypothetical protein